MRSRRKGASFATWWPVKEYKNTRYTHFVLVYGEPHWTYMLVECSNCGSQAFILLKGHQLDSFRV